MRKKRRSAVCGLLPRRLRPPQRVVVVQPQKRSNERVSSSDNHSPPPPLLAAVVLNFNLVHGSSRASQAVIPSTWQRYCAVRCWKWSRRPVLQQGKDMPLH